MEIVQPWQLYLILQADNIGRLVGNIAGIITFISYLLTAFVGMGDTIYAVSAGEAGFSLSAIWKRKWALMLLYTFALVLQLLTALMPSTKTAAIMFGVPAVINNPTFQQETGEVYQLLKKALSDTVQKKEQENKE